MTRVARPDCEAMVADAREKARGKAVKRTAPKPASICGHETQAGRLCTRKAGWGTTHLGWGPCTTHDFGWATMRADTKVDKYARPLLAQLTGYDIDVNPMDALLMCVRIAAAEVAYFSQRLAALGEDALVQRPTVTRTTVKQRGEHVEKHVIRVQKGEQLNPWMQARKASMRDLAQSSKMALDAGVEERMVRVQEAVGEALAGAVRSILDDLHLTPEQRDAMPEIVRKHLRRLGAAPTT